MIPQADDVYGIERARCMGAMRQGYYLASCKFIVHEVLVAASRVDFDELRSDLLRRHRERELTEELIPEAQCLGRRDLVDVYEAELFAVAGAA